MRRPWIPPGRPLRPYRGIGIQGPAANSRFSLTPTLSRWEREFRTGLRGEKGFCEGLRWEWGFCEGLLRDRRGCQLAFHPHPNPLP